MTDLTTIETKLTELAERLIDGATEEDQVDVFKAVATWHIAMTKEAKKDRADDDGASSFAALKSRLTANGRPQ